MSYLSIIPPLAFVVITFVWGYVFAQRRTDKVSGAFLSFAALPLIWVGGELIYSIPALKFAVLPTMRALVPVWMFVGVGFLNFAHKLLDKKLSGFFWLYVVASLIAVIVTEWGDLVITGYRPSPWGFEDERNRMLHAAVCIPNVLAGAHGQILVLLRFMRTKDEDEKGILPLLLVGGFITFSAILMFNIVLPNFFPGVRVPRFGSSAGVIFIMLVFWASRRYQFLSITVRQVAEDLFEGLADAVLVLDDDGGIKRSNPAARTVLGIGIEHADQPISHVLPHLSIGSGSGSSLVDIDKDGVRRNLSVSWYQAKGLEVPVGRFVIVRDETERLRAQEVLRQARNDLEREVRQRTGRLRQAQRMEALATLAGGVAHDFNNLLAAMMGFTIAARDELEPGHPVREDLSEVLEAVGRAREIIKQMLSFSDRGTLDLQHMDLAGLTRDAAKMMQVNIPQNVDVQVQVPVGEGLDVNADPGRIHQVVINLLNNAIHAMEPEGGKLALKVFPMEISPQQEAVSFVGGKTLPVGKYCCLEVSDTGCGMPVDVQERIFEPFYTTRGQDAGTGLGLATVLRIVEEHCGAVSVSSEPGVGTSFRLVFPWVPAVGQEPTRESVPPAPGTACILLVDDKIQVVKMWRRVLEPLGYRVTGHVDPERALAIFAEHQERFDVVITDLSMPGMDGIALSKKILAIRPEIPVILISGNISSARRQEALQANISRCLTKPVSKGELAKTLTEVLGGEVESP